MSQALRQRAGRVLGGVISSRYAPTRPGDLRRPRCRRPGRAEPASTCASSWRQERRRAGGVVAVRTPCMAEGYLGAAGETAAAFRDGWFITGDVATLVGPRTSTSRRPARRPDLDGGPQLPAAQLEAALRRSGRIADCCVLAANLPGGVSLGVAVVLAAAATPPQRQARAGARPCARRRSCERSWSCCCRPCRCWPRQGRPDGVVARFAGDWWRLGSPKVAGPRRPPKLLGRALRATQPRRRRRARARSPGTAPARPRPAPP